MKINYTMRYKAVKSVIETGDITKFEDIFYIVSQSRLAKDARILPSRLKDIRSKKRIKEAELIQLSNVIDVQPAMLRTLFRSKKGK